MTDPDPIPLEDEQARQWAAYETAELEAGRCPHSGLDLTQDGEAGPHTLSCDICDCFGYPLIIGGRRE